MPISIDHAFSRGMVSGKARAKALTRMKGSASMGLKGKVVGFDSSKATDNHLPDKGRIPKNEINARAHQKTVRVAGQTLGKPMQAGKGDYVDKPGQPEANAIDQHNGRKWPAVSKVRGANARMKNRGNSGGRDTNKGGDGKYYYGGPNSNER